MPEASSRSKVMPASPIRRLVPYAQAAEKKGVHVHYLNIGQPDVLSPDSFWKGVNQYERKTLAYSPSPGREDLIRAAIDDYKNRGIVLDQSQVLVTTGGSEATLFAFISCFNPGDEVIVVEPYYANYSGFAVESGVNLVALTSRLEDDFALPSVAEFEKAITSRTKGILICNPSNPTGNAYGKSTILELARLVKKHDLFLIVDEVYRDFYYSTEPLIPILTLDGLENHAVMIDSLSKRLSLCGARVGFLVSRNPEVMSGATKLAQARLSAGSLDQAGAAVAIRETPKTYYEAVRAEYQRRRDVLTEGLRKIDGVLCPAIEGAFYAFIRLPVDDAEKFCKWMLSDFSFEGETLLMAPGEGFYLSSGLGKDEVRIAYVLNEDSILRALRCLEEGLKQYPGRVQSVKCAESVGIG